jgi:hypothetical protein
MMDTSNDSQKSNRLEMTFQYHLPFLSFIISNNLGSFLGSH